MIPLDKLSALRETAEKGPDGSTYVAGGCGAGGITGGYGAGVSNRKGVGSTSHVVPGAGGMSSKENPSRQ